MFEFYTIFVFIILIVRMFTIHYPESTSFIRLLSEFRLDRSQQKDFDLLKYVIGNDKSLLYVTGWSILHMTWGIGIGIFVLIKQYGQGILTLSNYLTECLIIHSLWELYQVATEMTPYWTLRGWTDVTTDTVLFTMGAMLPFISTSHN
jgi:hypothetical protein